jgi:hypothetical protein
MVEHLPVMCEALGLIPSTTKMKIKLHDSAIPLLGMMPEELKGRS